MGSSYHYVVISKHEVLHYSPPPPPSYKGESLIQA